MTSKIVNFRSGKRNCASCGIPSEPSSGDRLCPDCRDYVAIADATATVAAALAAFELAVGRPADAHATALRIFERRR